MPNIFYQFCSILITCNLFNYFIYLAHIDPSPKVVGGIIDNPCLSDPFLRLVYRFLIPHCHADAPVSLCYPQIQCALIVAVYKVDSKIALLSSSA